MAFDTLAKSRKDAKPIKLYRFQAGSATPVGYTDGVSPETYNDGDGAVTYNPIRIQSPPINTSGNLDKTEFLITLSADNLISPEFRVYPPPAPMRCKVYYGHVGDTDFRQSFTGIVLTVADRLKDSVIACEPSTSSLRRPGLLRSYQFSCPYTLYKNSGRSRCPAVKATATTSVTVQAVGSTSVTLASGWNGANALTDYLGGTFEWLNGDGDTEVRAILSATATQLTLGGLIRELSALDSADVVLGCDRSERACREVHSVINDFGGQSNIPAETPTEVNQFY